MSGLGTCQSQALTSPTFLSLPRVLIISLPEQLGPNKIWTVEPSIKVLNVAYRLIGRVVHVNSRSHYQAWLRCESPVGPYEQAGIYRFDDQAHGSRLVRGLDPDNLSHAEIMQSVEDSTCVVYYTDQRDLAQDTGKKPYNKASLSQQRTRNVLQGPSTSVLGLQRFTPPQQLSRD